MDMSNNLDMDWLNIITIKDFQCYLNSSMLKEISMASRLFRKKLKPVLFDYILFSAVNLGSIRSRSNNNIFFEFYKCFYLSELDISLPVNRKDWDIQSDLTEISSDLMGISKYVKSFNLNGLDRSGYYIYPIVNNFHSLKFLELRLCFIPYMEFARLGESLPNLTSIKLISLYFTKHPTNNITLDSFIFPKNLNYLELYSYRLINSSLLSDPYEFLFNEEATQEASTHFDLPNIYVPSLKHLVFFTYYLEDGGLEEFLKTNPNLESLHIEYYNLRAIKSLKSLNSLEISDSISFDGRSDISVLKNLKKLKIEIQEHYNYEDINRLCVSCSNLEYLSITISNIEGLQQTIDLCIQPIIATLPLLKTLRLITYKEENSPVNFCKFSQIEELILITSLTTLLSINFVNCCNLKNVELISYSEDIDKSEFKDKFNCYENWKFKYFKHTIRGYKFNN